MGQRSSRNNSMSRATFAALAALCSLASAATADAATETQKLTASDASSASTFGSASAIDGDTLVIGSPGADVGANNSQGAVYVFQFVSGSWTETAKLTASDGAADDDLGSSVAIDGDTIVAGAFADDGASGADSGSVYTFARTGAANRTQTAKLTASDAAAGDDFGNSVAIDGDTIVAGAFNDDSANVNQGSVYTFSRAGSTSRTETAKLTASSGSVNANLGSSVAIDRGTIVAGAGEDLGRGAVYTFARVGTTPRSETAKLTASDGASSDELGNSVAIDGDTIVAGAEGAGSGAAYTFSSTGLAARGETAKLTASDGASTDSLGRSVAIDGDTIVAGAFADDNGANNGQGSVYTFSRTGAAARSETAKLTASDGAAMDALGSSVAVSGKVIVAGAPYAAIGVHGSPGVAYTFGTPPAGKSPVNPGTPGPDGKVDCDLDVAPKQTSTTVELELTCQQTTTVSLSATAKLPKPRKGGRGGKRKGRAKSPSVGFATQTTTLAPGTPTELSLKAKSRKDARKLAKVLRSGRKVKVALTADLAEADGDTVELTRAVKLKAKKKKRK